MPAERLYYADSALTEFTATVTDIREHSRTDGASLWQVALDRSRFYPTSGTPLTPFFSVSLMEHWARFCDTPTTESSIIPLRRQKN